MEDLQRDASHCDASHCDACIVHDPLPGEPDYRDASFPLSLYVSRLILPTDKNADPFAWAKTCAERFADDRPFLLIPGRRFDAHGTRHSKGHGWYDRFLSQVPRTWLRIGVADATHISFSRLERRPWDESVDWVLAQSGSRWEAYHAQSD